MTSVAIAGCAGYVGQELLDRILAHPDLEPVALGSDSLAGRGAAALDPRLEDVDLPDFVAVAEALACGADLLFLCLPHERAAALTPPAVGVVVDLSGAHRLQEGGRYAGWYGWEHPAPAALRDWCYALPELFPPSGRLIANPGCYATAALLALAPLRGAIDPEVLTA